MSDKLGGRKKALLKWTPFVQTVPTNGKLRAGEVMFHNNKYTVIKEILRPRDDDGFAVVHLSIRSNERDTKHDWRDYQRIKNELVDPECEGIEFYPAESRLVDTSNQYHLWVVLDSTYRFPLGFTKRLVAEGEYVNGAVQRPFQEKPDDLLDEQGMDDLQKSLGLQEGQR